MKNKISILTQFKQWILSIVKFRFIFYTTVKIKTKQFQGSEDKFYWFEQTGHYNVFNKKFYTDNKIKGSHNVCGFKGIIDFSKSIVS